MTHHARRNGGSGRTRRRGPAAKRPGQAGRERNERVRRKRRQPPPLATGSPASPMHHTRKVSSGADRYEPISTSIASAAWPAPRGARQHQTGRACYRRAPGRSARRWDVRFRAATPPHPVHQGRCREFCRGRPEQKDSSGSRVIGRPNRVEEARRAPSRAHRDHGGRLTARRGGCAAGGGWQCGVQHQRDDQHRSRGR